MLFTEEYETIKMKSRSQKFKGECVSFEYTAFITNEIRYLVEY